MKYDRIRVSELSEKPYALSSLISRGGYSKSNAFDMSVDKTSKTFKYIVNPALGTMFIRALSL